MVKNVYERAYQDCKEIIEKNKIQNPAVMFDIDDTLLLVRGNELLPNKPIINILKECNKHGIIVIIITARDSIFLQETMQHLAKENIYLYQSNLPKGVLFYNYLYLRQNPQDNHSYFKSNVKCMFTGMGMNIIISIGDNDIDLIGPYSGYRVKLPNQ
jgi:predicted secreted acid phosphatase